MGKSPFTCRVSVEQTPQVREGADGGVTQHLIEFFGNGVPLQGTHQALHEPWPDPTINIPRCQVPTAPLSHRARASQWGVRYPHPQWEPQLGDLKGARLPLHPIQWAPLWFLAPSFHTCMDGRY